MSQRKFVATSDWFAAVVLLRKCIMQNGAHKLIKSLQASGYPQVEQVITHQPIEL